MANVGEWRLVRHMSWSVGPIITAHYYKWKTMYLVGSSGGQWIVDACGLFTSPQVAELNDIGPPIRPSLWKRMIRALRYG